MTVLSDRASFSWSLSTARLRVAGKSGSRWPCPARSGCAEQPVRGHRTRAGPTKPRLPEQCCQRPAPLGSPGSLPAWSTPEGTHVPRQPVTGARGPRPSSAGSLQSLTRESQAQKRGCPRLGQGGCPAAVSPGLRASQAEGAPQQVREPSVALQGPRNLYLEHPRRDLSGLPSCWAGGGQPLLFGLGRPPS